MGLRVQAQTQFSGKVTDEVTGSPLVGARVLLVGTHRGSLTDEAGEFTFATETQAPYSLMVNYFGYDTVYYEVSDPSKKIRVSLREQDYSVGEVEITASASYERKRQSPLTVESMSINGIRETPSANFYDGLGSMKEVDLTAASIGFKVINTRGFNSAAPIRSLQIIDGVDNQSPGLNFSLGNFLGASELDVEQVDLVIGASSAYYGPNAFNGVISMTTKSPFVHRGLSALVRVGERNLLEGAIRYARAFANKKGNDIFAFKVNAYILDVNDWVANNLDPVDGSNVSADNPGGYDAVNRYGDEDQFDATSRTDSVLNPGLGYYSRTGYEEINTVDYDTRNMKLGVALHFMLTPKIELIAASNYANGTTVLQGDNRYSLKNIQFFQNRIEIRQKDRFFFRAYMTTENAGDSYDAVFTALRLQDGAKPNNEWNKDYRNYWGRVIEDSIKLLPGFPDRNLALIDPDFYLQQADSVLSANQDKLTQWHRQTRNVADYTFAPGFGPRLDPGTPEYDREFNRIVKTPIAQGGTKIIDRSSLYHAHGEYTLPFEHWNFTIGGNGRLYTPVSEGNIFSDTMQVTTNPDGSIDTTFKKITNYEVGMYLGTEVRLAKDRVKLNGVMRVDKNQNFNPVTSSALSAVWTVDKRNILRIGVSSAVRNPTLSDQYLYYDVGRAILLGNLNGVQGLVDTASFFEFLRSFPKDKSVLKPLDVPAIVPEKVQSIEFGYRTRLFKDKFFLDATYYYNRYRDFIGYVIGVDTTFAPSLPNFLVDAQVFRVAANARDIVTTQGFSIRLDYFFEGGYGVSGNYSFNRLNTATDDPIIPAYNTPEHKYNLSVSGRDVTWFGIKHLGFAVNYKWVQGFLFEGSPQFTGRIPSYGLVDAQINKRVPSIKSTFKLGASNILNNKVFQIYGGPRVGRLIYFSIITDLTNL